MKRFILQSIRFYQKYLNLDNPIMKTLFMTDNACRFRPTCSEYVYEAVEKHGIISGLRMGTRRILRCHPWSRGKYDPVPEK